MLESTLRWFILITVAGLSTAPVIYILEARMSEEEQEAAREALEGLKSRLEWALTAPGEVDMVVEWGEGGLPRRVAGGEVKLEVYPGHMRLFSAGKLLASLSMPDYYNFPPPILLSRAHPRELLEGQYHIPPFSFGPEERLMISSRSVGGNRMLFVYTRTQWAFARWLAGYTAPIIMLKDELLRSGGEEQFEARWDMLVGRGYAILTMKVGGNTYYTLQWVPVEVVIGQIRGVVSEVEYLKVRRGDTPTLSITSAGYTISLIRGSPSPRPTPE